MAARDKIKHAGKPATRIYPGLRLARLSKSGAGIDLGHGVPHTPKPLSGQPVSAVLLDSDDNCVRGARGIYHGQSGKARSGRIDQTLAPAVDFTHPATVHHPRPPQDATR